MTPLRLLPALLLVALLLLPPTAAAQSYPDPGKAPRYFGSDCFGKYDRRFVHDFVGVMDAEHAGLIEGAACEIYAKTHAHFVLAAVKDTGGESLEFYALHLFERWGIGQKDTNDGILLLYVQDYNLSGRSSAVRVEVGYGLEGTVNARVSNDAVRLMRDVKDDSLAAGDGEAYARSLGLAAGAGYLLQTLDEKYVDGRFPDPVAQDDAPPWWFWVVAVAIGLTLLSGFARSAGGSRGWGYRTGSSSTWKGAMAGWLASEMLRGGGRRGGPGGGWGGGGFGGGGGGFGGGRSGGGGGSGGF